MGEGVDDDRNPEWPDSIPNESTVIARSTGKICGEKASWGDICLSAPGHPGDHHWRRTLTEAERRDLEDEIEMDLL